VQARLEDAAQCLLVIVGATPEVKRELEELRGRDYDGGYDALRRYAKRWAKEHGLSTAAA
jgi:hypothetical protein